jgi:MEDS: MEthanogen/methylotroph, DcmR Sensory domain
MGLGLDRKVPRVGNEAAPQHSMQLFDSRDSVAEGVSGFIAEGVEAGDVVLAVMRRETWESTARRLRERGVDPAVAQASGGLTVLDAVATLETFLVNGRIDQKLFEDSVGTLVWALASSDRRLRIYGEMVDVLASTGDFRIALQLEARWNELRAETPFTLFCGYSAENFGNPKLSETLQLTCLAHSHIRTNPRDPLATFLLESASSGPGTS